MNMKGYKGFDENLQCRGFQYEVGKTYELNKGKLNMCENGFHFCKKLSWIHEYYSLTNEKTRVCEVEALGIVEEDGKKCVTDKIKIVRELTDEEKLTLFQLPNFDLEIFNDIMAVNITVEEFNKTMDKLYDLIKADMIIKEEYIDMTKLLENK